MRAARRKGGSVMSRKCIGIDIGGTTVKLGMFEQDGTLLEKWEIPTRKENGGAHILEDIAAAIKKKAAERGLSTADFEGAGMGLPGPVLEDGHVEFCVNLGWKAMNPQKILSGLLDGMPVKSANDANVAALGELWQGGGRGYKNMVMITLGTGVGGGIIINGKIVTGKTTSLLGASAAVLLNAVKELGGISDDIHLISPTFIEPIQGLKTGYLGSKNPRLHTDEVLIALSMCAATDPNAKLALEQLPKLRGCELHTSVMLSSVDTNTFKKLGLNLTSEPIYENNRLYH